MASLGAANMMAIHTLDELTREGGSATSDADIPVIDISGDGDQEEVALELVSAAVRHGFVYIRSTGKDIPVQAIDSAFSLSKRLFNAPLEEKQACSIQKNNRGYSGMHVETLDPKNQRIGDLKEAFNFGEFVNDKAQQPLPPTIAADEPQIASFFSYCHQLSLKLNSLLGIGLGVNPPSFFQQAHLPSKGPSGTTLRLLHYPPLSALAHDTNTTPSTSDVRAGAHSDYGSLTLLFRLAGQPGLEVQQISPSGGGTHTWAPVPVVPPGTESDPSPPILVNIGDLLSYWTGGLLRSTLHRVVFPKKRADQQQGEEEEEQPRYSIAFFCHPVGTCPLEPVPSARVETFTAAQRRAGAKSGEKGSNPYAERRVLTANEHLQMRLRASYLDLYGDEGGQNA